MTKRSLGQSALNLQVWTNEKGQVSPNEARVAEEISIYTAQTDIKSQALQLIYKKGSIIANSGCLILFQNENNGPEI